MAYDRAITVFSPDGRLFQVEYAREAVKRGTTTVGVKFKDGVVLIVDKRLSSKLIEPESIEKIFKIDGHIGCATSGLVADARALVDRARVECQVNSFNYSEDLAVESLVKKLCDFKQSYTQYGGVRPFGIQKTTFLKAAQRMKWRQDGKWLIAQSIVGSFESGSARLLIVLGADIALVASGNKKGEMRISTRASNRIVSEGFNLTKILEEIAEINGGSAGGHPGAAGYNGKGDPEAISEIARQKCVDSIRQLP